MRSYADPSDHAFADLPICRFADLPKRLTSHSETTNSKGHPPPRRIFAVALTGTDDCLLPFLPAELRGGCRLFCKARLAIALRAKRLLVYQ